MAKSLGKELAARFARFADELEKTANPKQRFTLRKTQVAAPEPHDPDLIRATRASLNASQGVFAGLLGVSVATLRAWEQGINQPHGAACRLMTAIRMQPKFWKDHLRGLVEPNFSTSERNASTKTAVAGGVRANKPKLRDSRAQRKARVRSR